MKSIQISEELHRELKTEASRMGMQIGKIVEQQIRNWLDAQKKKTKGESR